MNIRSLIILVITLVFQFSNNLYAQHNYVVKGTKLNVRKGLGVNFEAIGSYNKGDRVEVQEVIGDWGVVYVSGKVGYVNMNYLAPENTDSVIKPYNQRDNHEYIRNISILLLCLFVWISYKWFKKRCKQCKSWNAMKKIGTEIVGEKQSTFKRISYITDNKGYNHRNTYYIPATITYYNIYRKCKVCGYRDVIGRAKKTEN